MVSAAIAVQLRSRGHDVTAVTEDTALVALADGQVLEMAAAAGRALVTANIRDFVRLDQQWRAAGRTHGGLVFVSTKTFPQDRSYIGALVAALVRLLGTQELAPGATVFLQR